MPFKRIMILDPRENTTLMQTILRKMDTDATEFPHSIYDSLLEYLDNDQIQQTRFCSPQLVCDCIHKYNKVQFSREVLFLL